MKMVVTLVIVYNPEQILLGLKKRGFGEGRWNGFGGKIHEGETIEQAAIRELEEESGIVVESLDSRGMINFYFEDDFEIEVHFFALENYYGEAIETEEMAGKWYHHHEIPYEQMWADDLHWLPHVLQGKKVSGVINFDNPKDQNILSNNIETHA